MRGGGGFHTFVRDGPGFAAPIGIELGEVVERDRFVFHDVLPSDYRPMARAQSANRWCSRTGATRAMMSSAGAEASGSSRTT